MYNQIQRFGDELIKIIRSRTNIRQANDYFRFSSGEKYITMYRCLKAPNDRMYDT